MTIKRVTIKNVRGFGNQKIELDMIPNKPSLMVAPNGTGKSSFAIAFSGIGKRTFKIKSEDIHDNVDTNKPEVILETEQDTYVSNETKNEIAQEFAVFVINNQNKPKAFINKIAGHSSATTRMQVAPIVLVNSIPKEATLKNDFNTKYNLGNLKRGTIPSIRDILSKDSFMSRIGEVKFDEGKRINKPIDDFIQRLSNYRGTKEQVWDKIKKDDIQLLSNHGTISNIVNELKISFPEETNDAKIYLNAIQIFKLFLNQKSAFKKRIDYANYKVESNSYRDLFASLKQTWKNIQPKVVGNQLIIQIEDTDKISNGERDIVVFLSMLQKAKNALNKQNNILIIDEIFDYLDDANLIAAQYYITRYIEELKDDGKNIYPIIMTHLNPGYFKGFAFSELKVYYLSPHCPLYSSKMEILLRKRSELDKNDKKNGTKTDLISKYMLHFHDDYTVDMSPAFGNKPELNRWKDINVFKDYCKTETEKYLVKKQYDSVAVCVWIRECIEKFLYQNLNLTDREKLLDLRGTSNKINFAIEKGVKISSTVSLLGLIYNDNLHIKDNKTLEDSREVLYSRLENETIRGMIKFVITKYGNC